jgi:transposase-like protein
MSILVLKLPDVKRRTEERPKLCPYCAGETFQRWGQVNKAVRDTKARKIHVYRYCCCRCRRTFRHYPDGTTRADQTERLRLFAVICWTLGLSDRKVSTILRGLGIVLCPMTVWRDAQGQEKKLRRRSQWKPVRVLGVDGAYVLGWGEKRPVLLAVDLGEGQPVAVGYVNEHDQQAVRRWLEPIVQRLGVSMIVTDDLALYRTVAKQLNLEHQIYQFHVRCWVGKALKELQNTLPQEWLWVLDEIKELISE